MALAAVTSLTLVAALAVGLPARAAKPKLTTKAPQAIEIESLTVDFDSSRPEQRTFGKLVWLGGIQLRSSSPAFGGYSGLVLDGTGKRLVAVSDAGHWLSADIHYDGRRIRGLSNARIGPLLARNGRRLRKRRNVDAEAVTAARPGRLDGNLYIAFELNHRIGLFPQTRRSIGAPERYLALPRQLRKADRNKALEALTVARTGRFRGKLIAFTERQLDDDGNHVGWVFAGKTPKRLTLKRLEGFDVTGIAALPDGGLLVLERRFRFTEGIRMRLRRIAARDLRPGAVMTGEVLLHARGGSREIDNMEGVAVHTGGDGETVITLISDDNFNRFLQRTLLLQFALPANSER